MFRRQNSETSKRACDPDVEVVDSIRYWTECSEGRSGSGPETTRPESPLPRWGNQGKEKFNNSKLEPWMNSCSCEWYYHKYEWSLLLLCHLHAGSDSD